MSIKNRSLRKTVFPNYKNKNDREICKDLEKKLAKLRVEEPKTEVRRIVFGTKNFEF